MSNFSKNQATKQKIYQAFFDLLAKQTFESITVTAIIQTAGVGRSSFYRNFMDKEDLLERYMDIVFEALMAGKLSASDTKLFEREQMVESFADNLRFFKQEQERFVLLYQKGFAPLLQDCLNRYVEEFAGAMSAQDISRYQLYFIAGATLNVLFQWLMTGTKESTEDLAAFVCACLLDGVGK